jgi:hypothetical protein
MDKGALRTIATTSVVLAAVGAGLTLFVHAPSDDMAASEFHSLFLVTAVMIISHFGATLLFVMGLKGFSATFKGTYRWLVAGFVLLAFGFLQLPFINLFHFQETVWSRYGLVALPFVASVVSLYVGARGFAKLFGVRSILTSGWAVAGLTLVLSAASMFLPNATPNEPLPATTIQISKFFVALPALLNLWAAILGYQARKRAGSLFIPAMAWLALYLIMDSVCSLSGLAARLLQPGHNAAFDGGYMFILYALAGIVLVKAGVEFNKIRFGRDVVLPASEQTFFGRPRRAAATAGQGRLTDIITYTAGLASDTRAVDPILDELRSVTASVQPGQGFAPDQQQRLADTYLKLETYLSQQEKVRPISSEELRGSIQLQFAPILAQSPVFAQTARLVAAPSQAAAV